MNLCLLAWYCNVKPFFFSFVLWCFQTASSIMWGPQFCGKGEGMCYCEMRPQCPNVCPGSEFWNYSENSGAECYGLKWVTGMKAGTGTSTESSVLHTVFCVCGLKGGFHCLSYARVPHKPCSFQLYARRDKVHSLWIWRNNAVQTEWNSPVAQRANTRPSQHFSPQ